MTQSRRQFLASLAVAAVAPGAIGRAATAAAAGPIRGLSCDMIWIDGDHLDKRTIALWARQCGRNPAWLVYHYLSDVIDLSQIDLDSVRQAAALCDEPTSVPTS